MTTTQLAIQKGYEQMLNLPKDKLLKVLAYINQISLEQPPKVRLGLGKGHFVVPDEATAMDTEVRELFADYL